jgi:hypothetical protein
MPEESKETPPGAFTEAQIAALTELIGKTTAPIINAAVTSHMKRQPNPADEFKKLLTKDSLAPLLTELMEASGTKPTVETPGGTQPPKADPKIAALEAQLADMKSAMARSAQETKAAQEAARDEKALASLKSELAPHVRPEGLDMAADLLFKARKRVTFDEQGTPLMSVKRAPYAGAAEEDIPMPLTDGVQHWLKSEEAKIFIPAPAANTQQQRPGARAPSHQQRSSGNVPTYDQPATTDAEKIRRANEQAQILGAKYPELNNL